MYHLTSNPPRQSHSGAPARGSPTPCHVTEPPTPTSPPPGYGHRPSAAGETGWAPFAGTPPRTGPPHPTTITTNSPTPGSSSSRALQDLRVRVWARPIYMCTSSHEPMCLLTLASSLNPRVFSTLRAAPKGDPPHMDLLTCAYSHAQQILPAHASQGLFWRGPGLVMARAPALLKCTALRVRRGPSGVRRGPVWTLEVDSPSANEQQGALEVDPPPRRRREGPPITCSAESPSGAGGRRSLLRGPRGRARAARRAAGEGVRGGVRRLALRR